MAQNYRNITLALAGVMQACLLVNQMGFTGNCDEEEFATAIYSVFQLHADDVPGVFGDASKLKLGLKELQRIFNREKNQNQNANRYAISLIMLERLLMRNKKMQQAIRRRLEHGQSQISYFSLTHDNVIESLADIYMQNISRLQFRLHIIGKAIYLNDEKISQKIRALLLAGLRAAILWHQVGGRRWQLLFGRKNIARATKELLREMN
ncbi:MAG: high frequency lysogenization protein HflD [Pseudomonadota bacterium]